MSISYSVNVSAPVLWDGNGNFINNALVGIDRNAIVVGNVSKPTSPGDPTAVSTLQVKDTRSGATYFLSWTRAQWQQAVGNTSTSPATAGGGGGGVGTLQQVVMNGNDTNLPVYFKDGAGNIVAVAGVLTGAFGPQSAFVATDLLGTTSISVGALLDGTVSGFAYFQPSGSFLSVVASAMTGGRQQAFQNINGLITAQDASFTQADIPYAGSGGVLTSSSDFYYDTITEEFAVSFGGDSAIVLQNSGTINIGDFFGNGNQTAIIVSDSTSRVLINGMKVITPSAVTFIGSGLDDMSDVTTAYTGPFETITYTVIIQGTGTPDTFAWLDGTTYMINVPIVAGPIALSNGVEIEFGATTGHTLGASWEFSFDVEYGSMASFDGANGVFTIGTDIGNQTSFTVNDQNDHFVYSNNGKELTYIISGLTTSRNRYEPDDEGTYMLTNTAHLDDIPSYADDAAAIGGGLVTGDLYSTTTGGSTFLKILP